MIGSHLEIECPSCGAPAGVYCRRENGVHAQSTHYSRVLAFYESEGDDAEAYRQIAFEDLGDGGYRARLMKNHDDDSYGEDNGAD